MPFQIENGVLIKYIEKPGVTAVPVPDSVTVVGEYAFWGCDALSVIRPHEDAPALRRNYAKMKNLESALQNALKMLREKEYDADVSPALKYPFLFLRWLHMHDETLTAYIRDHMDAFMLDCIPAGDVCVMEAFASEDGFFTAKNIDRYINLAQEKGQNEIFMILLNYKNTHFGFGNPNPLRL